MGVKIQNNSDVDVDVYMGTSKVFTLKSGDGAHSAKIPSHLLGLRLETKDACKEPIFVEFKDHDKKGKLDHIFGEIGHPGIRGGKLE